MSFLGLKGKNRAPALLEYTSPVPPPPLLDGIQSDEPYVSFNSIHTSFPDINDSDVDAQHFDFPITFENDSVFVAGESNQGLQDLELASSVSYLPEAQILARLLGNGRTLELRWLGNRADTSRRIRSDNETLIRITFPHALRDISTSKCMYFNPTTSDLVVVLLDQWSDIYRLGFKDLERTREAGYVFQFDRREMFRNTITIPHALHQRTNIPTSANRLIWSVYSEESLVMALESSVIRCSWDRSDWNSAIIPNITKPKPGRAWPFSSSVNQPHASETIALTTYVPRNTASNGAFAYVLSRDRTLRAYDLSDAKPTGKVVNVHHGIGQLTGESSMELVESQLDGESPTAEGPVTQVPLLQVLPSQDDSWHYVFVLSPTPRGSEGGAVLRVYIAQVLCNEIVDISVVGHLVCSEETLDGSFRGFSVEPTPGLSLIGKADNTAQQSHTLGDNSQLAEAVWKVWTAWDLNGQTMIEWSSLTNMLRPGNANTTTDLVSAGGPSVLPGRLVTSPWRKVHDLSSILEPEVLFDSSYFDELLDDNAYDAEDPASDIKNLMLSFIFYPGRFSQHTLKSALSEYHSNLPRDKQDAQYLNDTSVPLDVKMGEIVGCLIELEEEDDTGLPELGEFRENYKREYLGFWATLQAQERQGRWPVLLVPFNGNLLSSGVLVVGREGVIIPAIDDELSLMVWLLDNAESDETHQIAAEKADFLALEPEPLMPFLSAVAEPRRRKEVSTVLSAAGVVANSMSRLDRETQQAKILEKLPSYLNEYSIDEAISTILSGSGFDLQKMEHLAHDVALSFDEDHTIIPALDSCLSLLAQPLPSGDKTYLTFSAIANSVATATQMISIRSKVAFEVLLVILVWRQITVDPSNGISIGEDEDWFDLIARATIILHRTLAAHWLMKWRSDSSRKIRHDDTDPASEKFRMQFLSDDDDVDSVDPQSYYSMFHTLISKNGIPMAANPAMHDSSVTYAARSALRNTSVAKFSNSIAATAKDVILAEQLFMLGMTEYALAYTGLWPSQNGIVYVRAKSMLVSGDVDESVSLFLSLANALHKPDWAHTDTSGLVDVLPVSVRLGGLAAFYRYVMNMFDTYGFTQHSTRFAELAIQASPPADTSLEALYKKVFCAYLSMCKYEEAYNSMIANPFAAFGNDAVGTERPLGDLIHAMCHNNQIQALLSLPFIGLEFQLEQELTFRARNSDPTATPNYYQILFAWLIMRTDYRQAAITMYQQGRRIGEHLRSTAQPQFGDQADQGEKYESYLAKQAQSYLAAIQAFSLTDSKNAWFTISATHTTPLPRAEKRRKVSSLIPENDFTRRGKQLEIVKLEDIKRDYSAVVALLTVVRRVGGELDPDAPLSVEDCVRYLCRDGLYDEAFLAAASYGCDMTEIFESLTERSLLFTPHYGGDLDITSLIDVDGNSSGKILAIPTGHAPSPPASHFTSRPTVLELDRQFPVPVWLVEWAINDQEGGFDTLVRGALKWGLVQEAVDWSRAYIMKSLSETPITLENGAIRPVYTPFSLLDQVVAAARDLPDSSEEEKQSKARVNGSVVQLKRAVEERVARLEGA
ncbi:hypothetical protein QFC22_001429 [Naganishia vaughanmartiniae]|uniref:Uncharacterized protein n=1 Tax=Naganishia vaughanmartiniae TaxID=1424756 RepID=A0ACC2XGT1_9TREE|nr:hypothetical protein QFC22_001429 [Naganishia vaughanmartiniae]